MDQLELEVLQEGNCPFDDAITTIKADIDAIRNGIRSMGIQFRRDTDELSKDMAELLASQAELIQILKSGQRQGEVATAYRAPVEHRPKSTFFSRFTGR